MDPKLHECVTMLVSAAMKGTFGPIEVPEGALPPFEAGYLARKLGRPLTADEQADCLAEFRRRVIEINAH